MKIKIDAEKLARLTGTLAGTVLKEYPLYIMVEDETNVYCMARAAKTVKETEFDPVYIGTKIELEEYPDNIPVDFQVTDIGTVYEVLSSNGLEDKTITLEYSPEDNNLIIREDKEDSDQEPASFPTDETDTELVDMSNLTDFHEGMQLWTGEESEFGYVDKSEGKFIAFKVNQMNDPGSCDELHTLICSLGSRYNPDYTPGENFLKKEESQETETESEENMSKEEEDNSEQITAENAVEENKEDNSNQPEENTDNQGEKAEEKSKGNKKKRKRRTPEEIERDKFNESKKFLEDRGYLVENPEDSQGEESPEDQSEDTDREATLEEEIDDVKNRLGSLLNTVYAMIEDYQNQLNDSGLLASRLSELLAENDSEVEKTSEKGGE